MPVTLLYMPAASISTTLRSPGLGFFFARCLLSCMCRVDKFNSLMSRISYWLAESLSALFVFLAAAFNSSLQGGNSDTVSDQDHLAVGCLMTGAICVSPVFCRRELCIALVVALFPPLHIHVSTIGCITVSIRMYLLHITWCAVGCLLGWLAWFVRGSAGVAGAAS